MAFTSIGYDGTVNERQWAELVPSAGSSTYGIKDADDLKVTAVPGQPLMVSVASGTAWGHGVMDTEAANTTITCDSISSGTRWDLIALRRNWQPLAGGPTSAVKVTGTAERKIPDAREDEPGVIDDQPLALVQWTAGQTQPTSIVDLRCWAGNGGLVANDVLALGYLAKLGASVTIAGIEWNYVVGANDVPSWVKASEVGKIPVYGTSNARAGAVPPAGTQFLVQAGTIVATSDGAGYGRITFPKPFPNGVIYARADNGDQGLDASRGTAISMPVAGAPDWPSPVSTGSFVYAVQGANGARIPNLVHRADYFALGW